MNQAVTHLGTDALNAVREVQQYSTGFFSNIFATMFIVAVIVLLH